MSLDHWMSLAVQCRALERWRIVNRAACEVELEVLRANLQHVSGRGGPPAPELIEHAKRLRRQANECRAATPLDYRTVMPEHPARVASVPAPRPELATLADGRTQVVGEPAEATPLAESA
jgi:hypothetical protein